MTAQVMNQYASRLDVEIPIFFSNFEEAIKALSAIINLADDFYNDENIHELLESNQGIIQMNSGITEGIN